MQKALGTTHYTVKGSQGLNLELLLPRDRIAIFAYKVPGNAFGGEVKDIVVRVEWRQFNGIPNRPVITEISYQDRHGAEQVIPESAPVDFECKARLVIVARRILAAVWETTDPTRMLPEAYVVETMRLVPVMLKGLAELLGNEELDFSRPEAFVRCIDKISYYPSVILRDSYTLIRHALMGRYSKIVKSWKDRRTHPEGISAPLRSTANSLMVGCSLRVTLRG